MDSNAHNGLQPLALLLSALSVLAGAVYLEHLRSYAQLLGRPEYSYLALTLIVAVFMVAVEAGSLRSIRRPGPERLLASLALLSMSTLLYALSRLPGHGVELAVFSLISAFWGLSVLVLDSSDRRTITLMMASLALLTPLPEVTAGWLSSATVSRLARLCSALTGAGLAWEAGRGLVLEIPETPGASLPAITVFDGASSILVAVPASLLLLYAALKNQGPAGRRVYPAVASLALVLAVSMAGCLAKGLLVLAVARTSGLGTAYSLATHLSPLLYGAAAIAAGLYAYSRLAGAPLPVAGWRSEARMPGPPARLPPLAAVLLLTLTTAHVVAANVLAPGLAANGPGPGGVVYLDELVGNTSAILFNSTGVKPLSENPANLGPLAGSSIVKEVEVEYRGSRYRGILEIADDPGDLVDLEEYLRDQGYSVGNETELALGNSLIRTIAIQSRSGETLMLLAATYRVPVYIGGRETTTYVRITLTANPRGVLTLLEAYKELGDKWGAGAEPSYRRIGVWAAATAILAFSVPAYAAGKSLARRRLGGGAQ